MNIQDLGITSVNRHFMLATFRSTEIRVRDSHLFLARIVRDEAKHGDAISRDTLGKAVRIARRANRFAIRYGREARGVC